MNFEDWMRIFGRLRSEIIAMTKYVPKPVVKDILISPISSRSTTTTTTRGKEIEMMEEEEKKRKEKKKDILE